ncbi:MAG TPA: OB-fold domain-containing protein [Acidimicrobiales bacterium]|nr:OB-fold domain-containing protein [Acidimicrobiales bacterium]
MSGSSRSDESTRPARLEPPVTDASEPFWEATRQRRLMLPWCTACDRPFWYPREVCPRCLGSAIEWRAASGRGEVYAHTVEHKPVMLKAVFGDEPYCVALVELDEGVRLMSNIVDVDPLAVEVGMRVSARWEPMSDGRHLLLFAPEGPVA